jgi:hypothetical protein
MERLHSGWEDNDGGNGEFAFDVAQRTVMLTHNQAYTEYETTKG